jgi:hypothetical protein
MALDFPNSPVNGQVYDNFIYNASKDVWQSISAGASPTILVNPTITNPTITDGVITATATTSSTIPLTVNGAASQTANLQEWKNSAGIILSSVNSQGKLSTPDLTVTRSDNSFEGGQINLSRALDNVSSWSIDSYGNGPTPELRVISAGGVAMTVNNSGHLSVPNQPSFFAWKTNSQTTVGEIVYQSVEHNTGNHYNPSNGRFTAPVPGRYFFVSQTIGWNTASTTRIYPRKNGASYPTGGAQHRIANSTNYSSSSSYCFTFTLAANDFVSLHLLEGSLYGEANPYSIFSGYLIG